MVLMPSKKDQELWESQMRILSAKSSQSATQSKHTVAKKSQNASQLRNLVSSYPSDKLAVKNVPQIQEIYSRPDSWMSQKSNKFKVKKQRSNSIR